MLREDVIGKIGRWWVLGQEHRTFYGQLKEENGVLRLTREVAGKQLRQMLDQREHFILQGQVESNRVTLRHCALCDCCLEQEEDSCCVAVDFKELFIGTEFLPETVLVKNAYVKYNAISAWFERNSYREHLPFVQDDTLLSFEQHRPLLVHLDGFDLQFDFGLSYRGTEWDCIEYSNLVHTVFLPSHASVAELYHKVEHFSQFLSLLQTGRNSFSNIILETTTGFNGEYHRNEPKAEPEGGAFWLTYPALEENFTDILYRWFRLMHQAEPVLEVLLQVLSCPKNTAGGFLLMAQALEICSNYFRAREAQEYARKQSDETLPEGAPVAVRRDHKVMDLLEACQPVLGFSEIELWKLAKKICAGCDSYLMYSSDHRSSVLDAAQREALFVFGQTVLRLFLLGQLGISPEILKERAQGLVEHCQSLVYQSLLKRPPIEPPVELPKIY